MYRKLFGKNLKKAVQDYMIYFCTLVISSALFFAFLSLTSRYNDILGGDGNYSLTMFHDILWNAVLALSVVFLALIRYINNYMLLRRSREFSVYMILGMEQRAIAGQFFAETVVFGITAVLFGCIVGTALSGILTAFVMQSILHDSRFYFGFYPDTILETFLFFGAAFLLAGLSNIRKIRKTRLIELLHTDRTGETRDKKTWRYAAAFFISLCSFAIAGTALYFFSHASVFYAADIPDYLSNRFQTIAVLALVAGIFALYHAAAFFLIVLRKGKRWKYRDIRLVFLGNLFQRVSSTAKILSISTLAITISFVAFAVMPMLSEIAMGYLEYRMPYDVMIYNNYRYIARIEDIPQIDFSFVGEILQEHGVQTAQEISQRSYFIWEEDFSTVETRQYWFDLPRLCMGITDYNTMRRMAGYEEVPLSEDGFFMHLDYETDMEIVMDSITKRDITLDDGTALHLSDPEIYQEPLGSYLFGGAESILVFPDRVCGGLHLARTCYYANTQTTIPYQLCDTIHEEIEEAFRERYGYLFERYEEKYKTDHHYASFIEPVRFRTQQRSDTTLTAASIRLLGIYSGVIFFIICMTVLALHLIRDCMDHRMQYRTLWQIGVEKEEVMRMADRQNFCYFFAPCAAALLIALVLIDSFIIRFGHKVFTYIGSDGFVFGVLIPALLIVVILLCYYGAAVYTIKRELRKIFDE